MAPDRGLSAAELAAVLRELGPALANTSVRDVAWLRDRDDLVVFFAGEAGTRAMHIAPGGRRARLTLTARRFPKTAFQTGPQIDRLFELLAAARFDRSEHTDGERACTLWLHRDGGPPVGIAIELFGNRGLWCVLDAEQRILVLSRLPEAAGRNLRPGERYEPPPPRGAPTTDPPSRFAAPVLPAIDAHFSELDQAAERATEAAAIRRAVERGIKRVRARIDGLERQREEVRRAPEVRRQADLLLAYAHTARGRHEIRVPDPDRDGAELTIPLDPSKPPHLQAERLYKRARKLEDGAAHCDQQREAATRELGELEQLRERLDDDDLAPLRAKLIERGLLKPRRDEQPKPRKSDRAMHKLTRGENFRTATSAEGYVILVGRDNAQNDRLSTSVGRGNDLWFHVGSGYAGSHVVVRVPKGKTASLETLLDAATLAVHFSKARGAELCEVIYTHCKHVRKPKGFPPGRVQTSRHKGLRVRLEPERLERLLNRD